MRPHFARLWRSALTRSGKSFAEVLAYSGSAAALARRSTRAIGSVMSASRARRRAISSTMVSPTLPRPAYSSGAGTARTAVVLGPSILVAMIFVRARLSAVIIA